MQKDSGSRVEMREDNRGVSMLTTHCHKWGLKNLRGSHSVRVKHGDQLHGGQTVAWPKRKRGFKESINKIRASQTIA